MMSDSTKDHWEKVYQTKGPDQVSWTQVIPSVSLDFIHSLALPITASIIDIGGGDSKLVDHLLDEGFINITVLDISGEALEKAKLRLGDRARLVNWVVSDITEFISKSNFDLWHDRATFHFLTTKEQIAAYLAIAEKVVTGYLFMGTFSNNGPEKCSGLWIQQYTEQTLTETFYHAFEKVSCITKDHMTPFRTTQNFLYCGFKRRQK